MMRCRPRNPAVAAAFAASVASMVVPSMRKPIASCRALSMRATAGDGGGAARTLARCLPPVVASFHIPKLWGFVPAVVVTMASWCGPSSGEGLVRVVRFDAGARSRRGDDASGATRSDAVSPQNGIDGAQTRLTES
jgi:hypothetical protein